jgi:hypothetical protein
MHSPFRREPLPETGQLRRHPLKLLEVQGREAFKAGGPLGGEAEAYHAVVLGISMAADQPGGIGPVRQSHRRVVAEQ